MHYSGVHCALGPSKSIRYSGVRFHIFYYNSAGLSDVVRYTGIFVIAGSIKAGCHCTVFLSSYRKWSDSLGERIMLWELEPQASVSTAVSSSSKLSRVFL